MLNFSIAEWFGNEAKLAEELFKNILGKEGSL